MHTEGITLHAGKKVLWKGVVVATPTQTAFMPTWIICWLTSSTEGDPEVEEHLVQPCPDAQERVVSLTLLSSSYTLQNPNVQQQRKYHG